jgi:hypothetical protein
MKWETNIKQRGDIHVYKSSYLFEKKRNGKGEKIV